MCQKNLITVPMVGTSIPHEIIGVFGAGRVFLKPAAEGTGAGGLFVPYWVAGVRDILTKCQGSITLNNVVRATLEGLNPENAEAVAALRKTIQELLG